MITVKRQFVQRTLAAITLVLVLGALSMIWPAIIERRGRDRGRDHRLSTLYITDRHHGIVALFAIQPHGTARLGGWFGPVMLL
jgi:hypothetical protein